LCEGIQLLPQSLVNIKTTHAQLLSEHPLILEAVKDLSASLKNTGRVLLRPSGTEPLLRVMVEGENSVKVVNQLVDYLDFYGTPYEIIVNKYIDSNPKNTFLAQLPQKPIVYIPFSADPFESFELPEKTITYFSKTYGSASHRIVRTQARIKRNQEYKQSKTP
jgi:hypothetical protein